jgi:hypothetical protein
MEIFRHLYMPEDKFLAPAEPQELIMTGPLKSVFSF